MVHRRAFSFTDDSANVAPEVATREHVFGQALEPAKQLFRLRQLESLNYQKLYHSDRHIMKDPWSIIALGLSETRAWEENLPPAISRPLRTLFLSEILYVNIVFLSAPGATKPCFEYSNATIFDNVVQYAGTTSSMTRSSEELALWTSHDVLRASFVAMRFLDVLEASHTYLFGGMSTKPPPNEVANDLPFPSSPYRGTEDMIECAINTTAFLDKILEVLCVRYGYSEPWEEFHTRSLSSLNTLRTYRERRATMIKIEPSIATLQPPSELIIPAPLQPTAPAGHFGLSWNAAQGSDHQIGQNHRTPRDSTQRYET